MSNLPAVVTILDLPLATTLSTAALFEAVQTTNGAAESVGISVTQLMTTALGILPSSGNTGQLLGKSSATNYVATWVDASSFVAANATSGLTIAGSTSLALALASVAGVSVLGVSAAAPAIATALTGAATQIFGVNTSTAGFFAATSLMPGPFKTATLGAFGVVIAQGTSALQVAAPSTAGNLLIDQGTAANPAFKIVSGDVAITSAGAVTIASNVVSYAKIQQGLGLSVIGFATTSLANATTFVASAANQMLRVDSGGTTMAFGLPAQVLLNTIAMNNVATAGDTTSFSSSYRSYLVTFENVVPSVATTATLQLQVATVGSTFISGGYVSQAPTLTSQANTVSVDTSTNVILLSGSRSTTQVGNGTTYGVSGFVRLFNPTATTFRKMVTGQLTYLGGGTAVATGLMSVNPSGFQDLNNALTGFQLSFSPGNIQTGTLKVYGLT